eukprot:TRINITY_DN2912_c0_g2_i3.p1 TRINITY_DN2912_c0_g2~~TRINITY_DN2912_c0_g2_i3.p1  ORF type:complete len:101 (-),score=7.06 TRINITY_DN2912_c0_g2_i3:41-343(-)
MLSWTLDVKLQQFLKIPLADNDIYNADVKIGHDETKQTVVAVKRRSDMPNQTNILILGDSLIDGMDYIVEGDIRFLKSTGLSQKPNHPLFPACIGVHQLL